MTKTKETPEKDNEKKSPEEILPSETQSREEHGPKISPGDESSSVMAEDGNGIAEPKELPPAEAAKIAGEFTAGSWQRKKRVSALYNTHHPTNAWMHIKGTGWVQLTEANESSCEAMNIFAAHAKVKNARIDYHEEGGKVTQMYIW